MAKIRQSKQARAMAREIDGYAAAESETPNFPKKQIDGKMYFFGGSYNFGTKRDVEAIASVVTRDKGYSYRIEIIYAASHGRRYGMGGIYHLWLRKRREK